MLPSWFPIRPPSAKRLWPSSLGFVRTARYEAYDCGLDDDEVSAARAWYQTFRQANLPSGNTVYSRSSGAGGQHVNK